MGQQYSMIPVGIQKIAIELGLEISGLANPYACYSCGGSFINASPSSCNGWPIICKDCGKAWCLCCGVLVGGCSTGGRCRLFTIGAAGNVYQL